jgi:hypothetical protein
MEEWGNKRANEYYEANLPAHVVRPKEGDPVRVVERFIRDKYEHKRYIAAKVPPKTVEAAVESLKPVPTPQARRHPVPAVVTPTAPAVPVPAASLTASAAAPQPSLLDFDEPVSAPAPKGAALAAADTVVDPFAPSGGAAAADMFGTFNSAAVPQPPAASTAHVRFSHSMFVCAVSSLLCW